MKNKNNLLLALLITILTVVGCGVSKTASNETETQNGDYRYLALGDSYTIGESVCKTCTYSHQLLDSLEKNTSEKIDLKIIAKTGWTTTDLLSAIENQNPTSNYDLVTLLIGVNNQYQNKPFSLYEKEFPELLNKAISLANGKAENVVVISIPDYAFTPFGQTKESPKTISEELDRYNAFAEKISKQKNIPFLNITDITRNGLQQTGLVASDGLHPSAEAYELFVKRLFSEAKKRLN